jgi:hypothetical protein
MEKLRVCVNEPMNIMLWGMSGSRDKASATAAVGWSMAGGEMISASHISPM